MFDVFTEEIEVLLKDGIANLYWFRQDLYKAWLRSGVPQNVANRISVQLDSEGRRLTKRGQMDRLYVELRGGDFNRRLEISRNFVRLLIEHKIFTPQDPKHRIEKAEHSSLKLRELVREQEVQKEYKESIQRKAAKASRETYQSQLLGLRNDFQSYTELKPHERGYSLEKLFPKLMNISGIPVQTPFKIIGEQIDGGIKYDGHYYLIELKWTEKAIGPRDIGSFYFKVDGKLDQRGIMISMGGYTDGVIESLPRGKEIRVMLLDGVHLSNVIFGMYTFQELLEHCISHASFKAELYCSHAITR
jgi:hypothetical protein